MKKKQQQQPSLFCPNHHFILFLKSFIQEVCICVCVCQEVIAGRKCYANVSHKHHFNRSHMHLCCVREHPFNVCILHTSVRVCWTAQCAVKWQCTGTVCWQPPCDRGFSCCVLSDTCLPGAQRNNKKENKPSEHGRLVSTRLEISQPTMRFPFQLSTSVLL